MKKNVTLWIVASIGIVGISVMLFFFTQQQEGEQFASWIEKNAIKINGTTPYFDSISVEKILPHFSAKKVIGIGESTHGTREFDALKLDILKTAVEKLRCRTVALEAGYSRCVLIDRSIDNSEVPIDSLVRLAGFTNLQTEEFKNILSWIRTYNKKNPQRRVSIAGIDFQMNNLSLPVMEQYYSRIDSLLTRRLKDCIQKINTAAILSSASPLPELAEQYQEIIRQLHAKRSPAMTARTEDIVMEQLHKAIYQYAIVYGSPVMKSASEKRDSCMAENVLGIVDTIPAGETILLFAHNGHIAKKSSSMGGILKKKLGSTYSSVGLDFYEGSFRANDPDIRHSPEWEEIPAEEPTSRNISHYFVKAGKPNAFLHLAVTNVPPTIEKWLYQKHLLINTAGTVTVNTLFNDDTMFIIAGETFDALFILKESHPTTPLQND